MHVRNGHFGRSRGVLAASIVALFAVAICGCSAKSVAPAPALAAEAGKPPGSGFVPTMADYGSIYDALQRYRLGLAKHDKALQESAYWEPPKPRPARDIPGMKQMKEYPGKPSWNVRRKEPGFVDTWDLPLDSYIHFESATRATHYAYFLPVYPQPEKQEKDGILPYWAYRTAVVGWPGHYEDVFEKRNGEWRILERNWFMNQKCAPEHEPECK